MKIRNILKSDLDDLTELMMSVYNESPWNDGWTKESAYNSLNTIFQFKTFYGNLVLEDGNVIASMLGYTRPYSKEITYYIEEFFVSNDHRRQGIGRELYEFSTNDLKNKGVSGAFFTTLKNSAAYDFYLKEGATYLEDSACFYHRF